MHETSLGQTLTDYLSGENIDETTYETFRQALARMLVEERGYPKDRLKAKQDICYEVDGEKHCRPIDLVVYDEEDRPLLLVMFCSGSVGSYEREASVAARLFPGGPAPLAVVSDTNTASLLDAASGAVLDQGMRAVPHWDELKKMAAQRPREPLSEEQRSRLVRIFHTYSGFLFGSCCQDCKPARS
ncbi:MAG: type I restriction enzyme HsdR N-terminal domain-containing protein [Desulfovibrionaceae bacterium]